MVENMMTLYELVKAAAPSLELEVKFPEVQPR